MGFLPGTFHKPRLVTQDAGICSGDLHCTQQQASLPLSLRMFRNNEVNLPSATNTLGDLHGSRCNLSGRQGNGWHKWYKGRFVLSDAISCISFDSFAT